MGVIHFIQENGFIYFVRTVANESQKKIFCLSEKVNAFVRGRDMNTYSQYCEDLFILRFFGYKKGISYIDIGAHSPDFLSNTKKIYEEYDGKGVNIEANPQLIEAFDIKRTNDKNLNIGIGKKGILPFGVAVETPISSFNENTIADLKKRGLLREIVDIEVFGLSEIFHQFSISTDIDVLSVDVEGSNLEVLETNDWKKFRPKLICIENDFSSNTSITSFLLGHGYKKIAYNGLNTFYIDIKGLI